MIGFGQKTYVPDNNFENYLETNGMGNGIANDDSVLTSNIFCPNPIIGKQSSMSSSFFIFVLRTLFAEVLFWFVYMSERLV